MKITALIIPAIALAAAACGGGYVGYGYETTGAYVDDDPGPGVDVETYPRAYYDGGWVYNVNGRYYRRNGRHWRRYREEPRGVVFGVRGGREHHGVDREHEHEHEREHHDHH